MEKIVKNEKLTYIAYEECINKFKKRFSCVQVASCGKTLLNKTIYSLVMGTGEKVLLVVGGTHGLEWITSLVLLRFCEELARKTEINGDVCGFSARELLLNRRLIVVPELNPDGIEIALKGAYACGKYKERDYEACNGDFSGWSANARGVDVNHNFNADWYSLRDFEKENGINGPSPRRFGGRYPESEPETRAVTRICRNIDIDMLVSLHSQGEEIYYEYGKNTPQKSYVIADIFSAVSGYCLVNNDGHAASGGLKDWFIEEFSRPAFTVEVGKGENPLPLSKLDEIYETVKPLLSVAMML